MWGQRAVPPLDSFAHQQLPIPSTPRQSQADRGALRDKVKGDKPAGEFRWGERRVHHPEDIEKNYLAISKQKVSLEKRR